MSMLIEFVLESRERKFQVKRSVNKKKNNKSNKEV